MENETIEVIQEIKNENTEIENQDNEDLFEYIDIGNDKQENTNNEVQNYELLQENIVLENSKTENENVVENITINNETDETENEVIENTVVDNTTNEQLTQIHEDLGIICSFLILLALVIVFRYVYKFFSMFFKL